MAENPAAVPETVTVMLSAAGDAPILSVKQLNVKADLTIGALNRKIVEILKKAKVFPGDSSTGQSAPSLFLYVNQAFAPAPDEKLGDLNRLYSSNGKLALHYALAEAWG